MTNDYPLGQPPDAFFGFVATANVDSISTRKLDHAGAVIDLGSGMTVHILTAAKARELVDAALDALEILDPDGPLKKIRELTADLGLDADEPMPEMIP